MKILPKPFLRALEIYVREVDGEGLDGRMNREKEKKKVGKKRRYISRRMLRHRPDAIHSAALLLAFSFFLVLGRERHLLYLDVI